MKTRIPRFLQSPAGMSLFLTLLLFSPARSAAQSQPAAPGLRGRIVDENDQPVARVEIEFRLADGNSGAVYTDSAGNFQISAPEGSRIRLTISKPGFFRIEDRDVDVPDEASEVSITLNHETEMKENLEVQSLPVQIDPDTTSHEESMVQHEILNAPTPSSHNLQQSMSILPQVLMDSSGALHVAGARQDQTEVLLDGFEVNDPGTGAFNTRVNVDTVRDVTIQTGGYGAEYAHAGAGILLLNTQMGDDKLRFGITNFIPDVSFQQGIHFGDWYPRVTFSAPLKKGKIWFSDAMTLLHSFAYVPGLPGGQDTDSNWSADNLLRLQANFTPKNIFQANFLYNWSFDPRSGLGALTPLSTTLDDRSRRYFVSAKDQVWTGGTLLEIGAAVDTGSSNSAPRGTAPYVVTPSSATGNYFQSQGQQSRRVQLNGEVTTGNLNWHGTHILSAGANLDGLDFSQQSTRSPIDFLRADSTISDEATFGGPGALRLANTQAGGFAQDLWRPVKPLVFSVGVRTDWDRLIDRDIVEPRVAMNWVPREDGKMKFTLAWGEHYQPLDLSILAQGFDQQRTDIFYNSAGLAPAGAPVVSSFQVPLKALVQPRSYNSMAEWDERFAQKTYAGASFLLRETRDDLAWELEPTSVFLLGNNRNDRYIAGEVWVRHSFGENAQIEVSYTRSRATSTEDLDPTLGQLLLSPQQAGPLLWDAPNRFVATGWTPIPVWSLLLSGILEYRTGFPFDVVNLQQELGAPPGNLRYPGYFSLNLGLEKRFHFKGHEWAARVAAINLTGRMNPNTVVNNTDATNYLAFAGGQTRAFTVRLRLVTEH